MTRNLTINLKSPISWQVLTDKILKYPPLTLHPLTGFRLIRQDGVNALAGERGLLLYDGGTVCDDQFSDQSADAICRKLGYSRSSDWSSGNYYEVRQLSYDIKLDDVHCLSSDWEDCTFSTSHNCDHSEDVFLTCAQGKCFNLIDILPTGMEKIEIIPQTKTKSFISL